MNRFLFLLGTLLLVMPFGLKIWEDRQQENLIATYQQELQELNQEEIDAVSLSARDYNEQLFETQEIDVERYQTELNVFGNGMMGSLEIPKISLKLPIYHGTEEEVLASGIGHLPESSLPAGGGNSHCVLTGHRGLPDAQLFTRLDELKEGDVFWANINNRRLCYSVCEINVVRPEEVEVLKIQEGRDLISLVTCTPYGINTHRLVVIGERISEQESVENALEVHRVSKRDLSLLILPFFVLVLAIVRRWSCSKAEEKERGRKSQWRQKRLATKKSQEKESRKRGEKRGVRMRKAKRKAGIKKWIVLSVIALISLYPASARAATGNITIQMQEETVSSILFTKIATMENGMWEFHEKYQECDVNLNEIEHAGELEVAARNLLLYAQENHISMKESEKKSGDNKIRLEDLEEGLYLITSEETDRLSMIPTLVSVPNWTGEEMSYEVAVFPKFVEKQTAPQTGWNSKECVWITAMAISLGGVLSLFCIRNRKSE